MFVVCGEALMDAFVNSCTPTGLAVDARVGGSPFNVAIGLARLGQPVAFFGGLSTDFLGDRLFQARAAEGIDLSALHRTAAHTTVSWVGVDARGVPSYTFHGERGADRDVPPAALAHIPPGARAFHFGSYAMVVEPVATTQRALVEREHLRSLISYDPNVRLQVEPSVGVWREALSWMLPRTHLLKVSQEDLASLYPGADPEVLAAQWLAQGVALVVVTDGSDGARAWTTSETVTVPAEPTLMVDTVGAGDTFQCGLLAWLAEHGAVAAAALRMLPAESLEAALVFANRAAAVTCARRGADLPRKTDIS